jgi:DNA repair protein RecO (recombination protein O)
MTRTYKAEGVVLRRRTLGETDKVLVLMTERRGKISVIAKGARKPLSKFSGAAEALNHLKVFVASGRNLDVLSQCEVKDAFHHLRLNLDGLATGTYLAELIDSMIEEHHPFPEIYHLMVSSLRLLERGVAYPDLVARRFEIQLMAYLGYEPCLGACARCGSMVEQNGIGFSASYGGVLCPECTQFAPGSFPMSRAALIGMRKLLEMESPEMEKARPKDELRAELSRILKDHIRHRHDSPIKSLDFLETLHHTAAAAKER